MFVFVTTLEVILFSILPSVYGLRLTRSGARYNVTGARRRASLLKVFAMWYTWTTLLLVSSALVRAEPGTEGPAPAPVATTRPPPRTLDRQAAELAWKSWLQSPESNNQNAPPRRITTKSLFITPLNCPEGQRLDRNGCVQVVTVNKDEHERILLEHLNAWFVTSAPGGDVLYDYGDADPGPLQLSIPIGLDPQAAPLQGQEPSSQAQELQPNYMKVDKKDTSKADGDVSIEAELELLKLQNTLNPNNTAVIDSAYLVNQNILSHNYPDKPKRDSSSVNVTETGSPSNITDEGQKELVYGHVNVDPILYNTEKQNQTDSTDLESSSLTEIENNATSVNEAQINLSNLTSAKTERTNSSTNILKKDGDQSKLSPENDYSDIGEAIKLISRYADVTTDDNFTKEQNNLMKEDSILGTRTKLQYRRNRPKDQNRESAHSAPVHTPLEMAYSDKTATHNVFLPKYEVYYRYPWQSQHSPTPPPDYPFRHLQDYWPGGRNQVGGVYNTHENPRRHHHSYPHNFRLHNYPHAGYAGVPPAYPEQLKGYIHRAVQRHADPTRAHTNNQDLYSLLGLRHWFSSEGTSKR